jgi:hypothetical protein
VWKNQNPWTSLRGQLYDVYLEQNGGFYGFMHGAVPLHVQLNLNDSSICVVNQTASNARNLHAQWELIDLHGNLLGAGSAKTKAAANSRTIAGKLFDDEKPRGFYFARLRMHDGEGRLLDENLYWLTEKESDWLKLEDLQTAHVQVSVSEQTDGSLKATLENTGQETAFFMRLKISERKSGKLLLPLFLEDNYITLFPGEMREIQIDLSHLKGKAAESEKDLVVAPWNGEALTIEL